jgi:3-oxoacyl-[acyl-carrier-protein] synthase II
MGALSKRNDEPEKASRPFEKNRDGFVLGEGAGVVIFEEMEHAKKRGAKIYGEVIGFGMSSDAFKIAAPEPSGVGPVQSMKDSLKNSRLAPEDIDYINAHGTATPLGDEAETMAIKEVFGGHAKKLMVSSSKSMIGHLLGASGGAEFIVSVLSVHNDVATPTINYEVPDPKCDLDYVPNESRKARIRYAMSNSFGFGGHNASIIIGKV